MAFRYILNVREPVVPCKNLDFGENAYTFRVSQEIHWYRYLREIADIEGMRTVKVQPRGFLRRLN
jgi:hypothetical protein